MSIVVAKDLSEEESYALAQFELLEMPARTDDVVEDIITEVEVADEKLQLLIEELQGVEVVEEADEYAPSQEDISATKTYPLYETHEAARADIIAYKKLQLDLQVLIFDHDQILESAVELCQEALSSRSVLQKTFKVGSATRALKGQLGRLVPKLHALLQGNKSELAMYSGVAPFEKTPDEVFERMMMRRGEIALILKSLPFRTRKLEMFAEVIQEKSLEGKQPLLGASLQRYQELEDLAESIQILASRVQGLRNKICEHHFALVRSMARLPMFSRFDKEELFQEGVMILQRVLESYDPERGTAFLPFAAYSIRQGLKGLFQKHARLGTLKASAYTLMNMARNVSQDFFAKHGREPDDRELAQLLEVAEDHVQIVRQLMLVEDQSFSLDDSPASSSDDSESLDMTGLNFEELSTARTCLNIAKQILDKPSYEVFERTVVFGQTYNRVGYILKLSPRRVRYMHDLAVAKVREAYDSGAFEEQSLDEEIPKIDIYLPFEEFYERLKTDRFLPVSMKTLDRYAGDTLFWKNFFVDDNSALRAFKVKLSRSDSGFDLGLLSKERKEIFFDFFRERYPDLHAIDRDKDASLATLLGVQWTTRAIQREVLDRGWLSGDLPPGASITTGNGMLSPYIEMVDEEQGIANLNTFIRENYRTLDDFKPNAPGIKGLAVVLEQNHWDFESFARYACRVDGPLSTTLPRGYMPKSSAHLSFYFRSQVVGRSAAYMNAHAWVLNNIHHLGEVNKTNAKFLKTLILATDYEEHFAGIDLPQRSPAWIAKELIRRGWVSPTLPPKYHGVGFTKHFSCKADIVGSDEIAAYNRAAILGRPLPKLPLAMF